MNMDTLRPKNWSKFQHYKDRSPPWIKLHREILDDFDYASLPLASKALAPLLWLLAADNMEGDVPADPARLAHRLRWALSDVVDGLKPLLDKGFMVLASGVLAECLQDAIPETETETYKEEGKKSIARASLTPDGFDRFWAVYPNKQGKQAALKTWKKQGLEPRADEFIAHVQMMLRDCSKWRDGFIPEGSTYVNQGRWDDRPRVAPQQSTVPTSKAGQAIVNIEGYINGLDNRGNRQGHPEADLLVLGSPARK
jgi:hypothetical protein